MRKIISDKKYLYATYVVLAVWLLVIVFLAAGYKYKTGPLTAPGVGPERPELESFIEVVDEQQDELARVWESYRLTDDERTAIENAMENLEEAVREIKSIIKD